MDSITYKAVKDKDKPEYWVAMKDGKVIAQAMSEQGVRNMVLTIARKQQRANKQSE